MTATRKLLAIKPIGERWTSFMHALLALVEPAVNDSDCWLNPVSIRRPSQLAATRTSADIESPDRLG